MLLELQGAEVSRLRQLGQHTIAALHTWPWPGTVEVA